MVLMALDHTRDFLGDHSIDALDVVHTSGMCDWAITRTRRRPRPRKLSRAWGPSTVTKPKNSKARVVRLTLGQSGVLEDEYEDEAR